MNEKGMTKFFTLSLTILIFSIVGKAFAEANALSSPWLLYFFVVIVTLVIASPLPWFLKYPLEFFAFLLTCFSYFSYNLPFGWRWFRFFSANTFSYLDPTYQGKLTYLPENLALVIFLLGFLILLNLILVYRLWRISYLFSLGYLIMLTISNGTNLTKELVMVSVLGLALAFTLQQAKIAPSGFRARELLVLSMLVLISFSAWYFPQVLPNVQIKIVEISQGIKRSAQSSRWYDFIVTDYRQGMSQLGFSESDEVLGGPVRDGQGLAFEVAADMPHYWQVSAKDIYTGQGWQVSQALRDVLNENPFVIDTFPSGYKPESERITLTLQESVRFIPKPSGRIELTLEDLYLESDFLRYSPQEERLFLDIRDLGINSVELELLFNPPNYTIAALKETSARYNSPADHSYLDLPEELPQRVRDLAEEITSNSANDYERVKAIEQYLKFDGDFTYSLSQARRLPPERDYVDYFLFEHQIGYCEHFSTAMVVLVRSLGLPARWAKGFSEGQYLRKTEDGRNLYAVGNENAHAWPEVYFAGIGWVPFEPTKSFSNTAQAILVANEAAGREEAPTPTASSVPTSSQVDQTATSETDTPRNQGAGENENTPISPATLIFTVSILVVLVSLLLFSHRQQISWWWLLWKVQHLPGYQFELSFVSLLKRLNKVVPQKENQTLKEYREALIAFDESWAESLTTVFQQGELSYYGSAPRPAMAKKFLAEFITLQQVTLSHKKNLKEAVIE